MISDTEKAVLEIGTGAWFITAFSLVVVFGFYIAQRVVWDDEWRHSPTVRAAFALAVFGAGSAIRASLAWWRFSHGDFDGAEFIITYYPWFEVSIIMNAVGAAIAVYVLAPGYRTCVATGIVLASFIIPALIWYF